MKHSQQFLEAVKKNKTEFVIGYLTNLTSKTFVHEAINTIDMNGYTPLMWAASLGYPEMVVALVNLGADINLFKNIQKTNDMTQLKGGNALTCAARGGHYLIVRYLSACNIDERCKDNDNKTALQNAVEKKHYLISHFLMNPYAKELNRLYHAYKTLGGNLSSLPTSFYDNNNNLIVLPTKVSNKCIDLATLYLTNPPNNFIPQHKILVAYQFELIRQFHLLLNKQIKTLVPKEQLARFTSSITEHSFLTKKGGSQDLKNCDQQLKMITEQINNMKLN